MSNWISTPQVSAALDDLYRDAAEKDPKAHEAVQPIRSTFKNEREFFHAMNQAYLPIGREFGRLLYAITRGASARTVVEFGTSFGISTIYLAAAVRDNGAGKVITTEFEPGKAEQAHKNLAAAGLDAWVEIRLGDALETLRTGLPAEVDVAFLDGVKSMYLDVLKTIEPRLRRGALVAADNTDHDGMENFLTYIRTPANGYTSAAILTTDRPRSSGHEVSIRN